MEAQVDSQPIGGVRETIGLDSRELAKNWLLTLLRQAPLDRAPAITGAGLVREGPRVCEAILAALESEAGLARLRAGGELRELAERIGELSGAQDPAGSLLAVEALRATIWSGVRARMLRIDSVRVWDLAERLAVVTDALTSAVLRRHQRPDWPAPLQDAVAEARREGRKLSVLLVELPDADLIGRIEAPARAEALWAGFREAVADAVEAVDTVVEAGEARVWVVAPGSGRGRARRRAEAIDEAVRALPHWRGASLAPSVGIAVLGRDADDAHGLVQAAERSRLQAEPGD